jgi:phosphoribosylformylglycinamidine (FGAM) synthase PurS component
MNGKKHIPLLLTFSILLLISSSENEQKNEFQSVKVNKFFNLNYAENPDKTADLKPDTISYKLYKNTIIPRTYVNKTTLTLLPVML